MIVEDSTVNNYNYNCTNNSNHDKNTDRCR